MNRVLVLCGVLTVLAARAAAQECEYEHTYLGNLPKQKEPGWHFQAQGLSHDASRWYISQIPRGVFLISPFQAPPAKCFGLAVGLYQCPDPTLWRIPLEYHLSEDVECGDPTSPGLRAPVCARLSDVAPDVWAAGYDHYGDIDYYEADADHAYVCVPLEGSGNPGAMAFFKAEDLSFVAKAELNLERTAAWCAIDSAGFVYSSGKRDGDERTDTVRKYHIDWSQLSSPMPEPTLTEVARFSLQERDGTPLALKKYLQGGTFSGDGRVLYLTNGAELDSCDDCGIHAFELGDADVGVSCDETGVCVPLRIARRVAQSTNGSGAFNYEYHPTWPQREEPEGLTWWDLSSPDAPPVGHVTSAGQRLDTSQLHALLLDNDALGTDLGDDDDVYIKHYRADVRCEPRAGIAVTPRMIDFGDVDIGGSKTLGAAIANQGDADLGVQSVATATGADSGFGISSAPSTPVTIPPGGSESVEIHFTPSSAELATGSLEITSDDPDEPHIEVALAGTGVSFEDQLRRLLELFDEAAGSGLLAGTGAGSAPRHRLAALRAMLAEALALLERGEREEACAQLHAALLHTDGEGTPKDLVSGDAASEVADAIRTLRGHLACAGEEDL